jgi:cell division protein ZapA
MAKADIEVRGHPYSIACAPGQENRIRALAAQLDERVTGIAGAVGEIGDERLLLIAALAILDELDTAKSGGAQPSIVEQKAAAALNDAAARIEAIAMRIEQGQ